MKIVNLIGVKYLVIILTGMLVFRYGFLEPSLGILALNDWQYLLMVLATLLVAAGGLFVSNSKTELELPQNKLYNIYGGLSISGLVIGLYLAHILGNYSLAIVYFIAASMMYVYSGTLKQMLLISNVVVAIIAALPLMVIAIYNLYPIILPETQANMATIFSLLLDYSLFILLLVFILTLVYDLKNVDTDYNDYRSTLPIVLGKGRAGKVVFFLMLIPVGLVFFYINTYLMDLTWATGYLLLTVVGPAIYFLIKLWGAKTTKEYSHLAKVIELILFFTAISVAVINYNINYNNA